MARTRVHRPGFRYTWFVITHNADRHRTVLVGPNGKQTLNEDVGRAKDLEKATANLAKAYAAGQVDTRRVTLAEFREIVRPVKNSGPKKANV